jgi:glucokinase
MQATLGVDLGGTNLRAGLVDSSGELLAWGMAPTRHQRSPEQFVADLEALYRSLLERVETTLTVTGLGLAVPGPLNPDKGTINGAVNLPGWNNIPLIQLVEEALGLRTTLVNDGSAFVLGEVTVGALRSSDNALGLTLGTGVGGGLFLDGRLHLGATGNACEIGHLIVEPDGRLCLCGRRGCLEQYASASAVRRNAIALAEAGKLPELLAQVEGNSTNLNTRLVSEAAIKGNLRCRELFAEAGRWLGRGIAQALTILDLDDVVVGGGMAQAGELILAPARESIRGAAFPPRSRLRLVQSELGDRAAIIGSALWAGETGHRNA